MKYYKSVSCCFKIVFYMAISIDRVDDYLLQVIYVLSIKINNMVILRDSVVCLGIVNFNYWK